MLTAPLFWIRIGLPSRHWWPAGTEAGQGLDALSRMGVAGYVQPIRMLVEVPEGRSAVQTASLRGLRTLSDSLRADPRVREVRSLVDLEPGTSLLAYSVLYSDMASAREQYPSFVDAYLSADRRLTLLDVIPADTTSLTSMMDLVKRARALGKAELRGTKGMQVTVGGYTASALDFQADLLERFPLLVALILGATAVMLAIAFRSVLVPIKAIIMNTLSVSATFGLIVLVFQFGVGSQIFGLNGPTSAIFVVIPVLVFAVGVRAQHGLRGVPAEPDQGGLRPLRPQHRGDHGGAERHRVDDHLRRAHHDPGVRRLRVRPGAADADAGVRARDRGAAGRDGDPDGAGAGVHAGDGAVELVARESGGDAGGEKGARVKREQ